ncbi:MAG: rod-binding protein [Lachnospiraceae bacterium]|nr:rod-binding protein [Lachnospiraceae bacterium]
MSDITGMANVAAGAYTSASASSTEALSSKLKKTSKGNSDEELMEAAKQFESYFVEQVFKEMQKSVDLFGTGDKDDNMMLDYVKDIYNQKLAEQVTSQGNLGIAQQLFENMKRNYGSVNITDAADETTEPAEDTTEA